MVWSTPMTAVAGNTLLAAQYNEYVRDCFLELGVARVTTFGGTMVTSGSSSVTARYPKGSTLVTASETTTSTTYTDLATSGPSVSIETGTEAVILWAAYVGNTTTNSASWCTYAVQGTNTIAATDSRALVREGMSTSGYMRAGQLSFITGLNPGINTFKMVYRVTSDTGVFALRQIIVIPL